MSYLSEQVHRLARDARRTYKIWRYSENQDDAYVQAREEARALLGALGQPAAAQLAEVEERELASEENAGRLAAIMEAAKLLADLQLDADGVGVGEGEPTTHIDPKKVFIVHGHDKGPRHEAARLLENGGLEAVILEEQPGKGQTIIEKLEANSQVGYAVVLFTGDDEGREAGTETLRPRARQNAVLELGYFMARLGRGRVCVLYEAGVEMPSDYDGVEYIAYDDAGAWPTKLVRELLSANIAIDSNKALALGPN